MNSLFGLLKSQDKFGQPITVNFQGGDTVQSSCGAIFSILANIVVLAFAIIRAQTMIDRSGSAISTTVEYIDYATDTSEYNMRDSELDAIIKFEIISDEATYSFEGLDERYGRIVAYQVDQEWPFSVRRRMGSGRKLESIDSVSDYYLDASEDTTGLYHDTYLPLEDCSLSHHLKRMEASQKEYLLSEGIRKCVDLTEAKLAGGTQDGNVESIAVIEFQHCSKYRDPSQCATLEEFNTYMADVKITLEMATNYVKFSEVETDKAIDTRVVSTLYLDTAQAQFKNVKGLINLSVNEATFMDTWYSFYPDIDVLTKDFMTVEDFIQFPSNPPEPETGLPNFGFTFVFKRSSAHHMHDREVYTILEFLGDVGGLNDALTLIIAPFVSFFVPALTTVSILNSNFKLDDGNGTPSRQGNSPIGRAQMYPMPAEQPDRRQGLLSKLRTQVAGIKLRALDLPSFQSAHASLKKFSISFWWALAAEKISCLFAKDRSIKTYKAGKAELEKRLDILKLIRTSIDVEILKKLYLLPRQRTLFKKQRRQAFKVDQSSSSSAPSNDSDHDCALFDPDGPKSVLNGEFKNTTDRRLLLGIMVRDNDLEPRKAFKQPLTTNQSAAQNLIEQDHIKNPSQRQIEMGTNTFQLRDSFGTHKITTHEKVLA